MWYSTSSTAITIGILILHSLVSVIHSATLPNFSDLKRVYPGYRHHGGKYHNMDIFAILSKAPLPELSKEDTSALRLSIALNKLGGKHTLGTKPIRITKNNNEDSVEGRYGLQYIYRTIAYGPYLAMKYKSPELIRTDVSHKEQIIKHIRGKQGILRMVTFHDKQRHADARIELWDCTDFYQSRDWLHMHHLIAVEFWELPDSKC